MGLRAALHEDCKYTIAEMVYGKTIKLPGEFFEESNMPISNDNFVSNLRNQMALLKPYQSKSKCKQKIFIPKDLYTCSHVFLRVDRVKKPLEPPYEGPFLVLQRTPKYFLLSIKNKQVSISVDRLKPAYVLQPNELLSPTSKSDHTSVPSKQTSVPSQQLEQPKKLTRCGRQVKLPVRFNDVIDSS
ncbi:uncharacterized protein LOC118193184 [Stegodyphus dumicola]|uniref:uncharacterized protein LOC118193184 n=1 Tax=Stegodyphus dumicola TaxID=202533 RepID=UPI0015AA69F9|nr:uncharacterized protein LOC118193184 [Stegodyphus dumicola]